MFNAHKGQIALTDLVFALIVFLVILTAFFTTWSRLATRLDDTLTFQELELSTLQLADLLTKSPGVPTNWETAPANVQTPGLARQDRVLSPAKVQAFANLSTNTTLALYNLKRFNLYVLLKQGDQTILERGEISSRRAVQVRRIVTYENQPATIDIALSKN